MKEAKDRLCFTRKLNPRRFYLDREDYELWIKAVAALPLLQPDSAGRFEGVEVTMTKGKAPSKLYSRYGLSTSVPPL
jgi:hypothetical protein